MALDLRPKKAIKGQAQKWQVRFQLPAGKRNKQGEIIYQNWTWVIGERGKMTKLQMYPRVAKKSTLLNKPPIVKR